MELAGKRRSTTLPLYAALAGEKLVNRSGVSKNDRFVDHLGALIAWRHLVSLGQRGHRLGLQIMGQRRLGLLSRR
jgi:hypothetical protein